ncbi:MAG: tRNA lysidine(34) synthetase TilS [Gemmatimonadota bacterium]|nr:tRNA lysidine(34) synthetase TilS [Gemmatimonadota bacterium]
MTAERPLSDRIHERLASLIPRAAGFSAPTLVVALSGGLDSTVLMHLLRYGSRGRAAKTPEAGIVAAHFDHCMRPGSDRDAAWVRGLCRAWDVELVQGRAETRLDSEASARDARYRFLEGVRQGFAPGLVLTAHHADDQAETVLFRVLRGSGIDGLAGIPSTRSPGIVRPLLEVWREELERYAAQVGLTWREDASNDARTFARNVIRNDLLPLAEARVAPGAKRSLVRLASIAREESDAWQAALEIVLDSLSVERSAAQLSVDRDALLALGPPLAARVVRLLAAGADVTLGMSATERAMRFCSGGASGSGVELGAGVELRRALDRMVVRWIEDPGTQSAPPPLDEAATIPSAEPGQAEALVNGRPVRVRWGRGTAPCEHGETTFRLADLAFPLRVRNRVPGDRIELAGGTRKVKKVLLDARIPLEERDRTPMLVDRGERVLWIPGVARSVCVPEDGDELLWIVIEPATP